MKYFVPILAVLAAFALFSCKKSGNNISIVGNWSLINDSTDFETENSGDSIVNYIGKPVDYFDFTQDGHFYQLENNFFDTATYMIANGNDLNLIYSHFHNLIPRPNEILTGDYGIRSLSEHNLVLVWATQEGTRVHGVINLKR
jgi:hypothetical protein